MGVPILRSDPEENRMNTAAFRLTQAVMIAATLAAGVMAQAASTALPVLQFPEVSIETHADLLRGAGHSRTSATGWLPKSALSR
jgi:hypothetical protein